ncbi:MAG TPA: hypothetical protein PLQ43_08285, partial [Deltaproteobacteria bacterium]|nr:hypothetical protein [Deltaproteobacteria bacterium]
GMSYLVNTSMNKANLSGACLACSMMDGVRIRESVIERVDLTLLAARGLDITGSSQKGVIVERAKVQGLIK